MRTGEWFGEWFGEWERRVGTSGALDLRAHLLVRRIGSCRRCRAAMQRQKWLGDSGR